VGVDLLQCLELFSREETLDADNAWYCPQCKEHREASKKIEVRACVRECVRAAVLACM
jgi:ubiquitin carboxyl-terminal hydrolase 4/11/15